jgi:hypothetical protein
MKYATGNYLILGFDIVGTKIFTKKADSQTHTGAIAEGEKLVDDTCSTFVVIRVQYNSATRMKEHWE